MLILKLGFCDNCVTLWLDLLRTLSGVCSLFPWSVHGGYQPWQISRKLYSSTFLICVWYNNWQVCIDYVIIVLILLVQTTVALSFHVTIVNDVQTEFSVSIRYCRNVRLPWNNVALVGDIMFTFSGRKPLKFTNISRNNLVLPLDVEETITCFCR